MSERHSRVSDCRDAGVEDGGEEVGGSSDGRQRVRVGGPLARPGDGAGGWRKGGRMGAPRVRPDFNDSSATES